MYGKQSELQRGIPHQAVELPAGITNLDASLSKVQRLQRRGEGQKRQVGVEDEGRVEEGDLQ